MTDPHLTRVQSRRVLFQNMEPDVKRLLTKEVLADMLAQPDAFRYECSCTEMSRWFASEQEAKSSAYVHRMSKRLVRG